MTQTTIYLLVNRGDETLMLDGSLYLFNELVTALKNVTKEITEPITPPPEAQHAESTQAAKKRRSQNESN